MCASENFNINTRMFQCRRNPLCTCVPQVGHGGDHRHEPIGIRALLPVNISTHAYTHARTRTYIHVRTHTHTHTHAHTHIHTYICESCMYICTHYLFQLPPVWGFADTYTHTHTSASPASIDCLFQFPIPGCCRDLQGSFAQALGLF